MIVGNSSMLSKRSTNLWRIIKYRNRQKYRAKSKSIFDRSFSYKEIISVMLKKIKDLKLSKLFGKGDSAQKIVKTYKIRSCGKHPNKNI